MGGPLSGSILVLGRTYELMRWVGLVLVPGGVFEGSIYVGNLGLDFNFRYCNLIMRFGFMLSAATELCRMVAVHS